MASSVSDTSSPTAHNQDPTENDMVESPTNESPTNEDGNDKRTSKSANTGTTTGSRHRNPKMRLIKKREAEGQSTGDGRSGGSQDLPTASSSSKARSPGTISSPNVGVDGGVGQEVTDSLEANVRLRHGLTLDDQFNAEFDASTRLSETSTREVAFRGRRKTWREVFIACLKCVIPRRRRDLAGYLFIFLGYAFLYPGLFWDVISLHSADGAESRRSTYATVRFLLTHGGQYIFPGVLLCFFSIFVPWLKGFLLIIGLVCGRKPRLLVFVARISKYQMVDIFVTLLLVGFLDNEIIRSNVEVGFYYFLGYCINSIVGTTIIASGDDTAELAKKRGLTWLLLANVMIISLGCIMFLPIYRISAVMFGKLILASSQISLGGIMLKFLARGHILELMLILITVVVLPMLAYVVAPCLRIRPGAKGRIIAILHEWAMADAWLIAILVGWTSFDSNEMLKVETVPAGTYFNLLYGVSAFCIIHFCLGDKAHGIAERYSILDFDEAEQPVSDVVSEPVSRVSTDGEPGQIDRDRVHILSRHMDQRNFKKKTSVIALFVLLLVPGFTLCGLIHFQAVNDVTLEWINEALAKNLASVNKAITNYSPETIGCCESPCKTDIKTLPDAPVPKGTCYNVGNGALYEDNTARLYYAAARWLTNLKQITLHNARIEPVASKTNSTKRIALIVEGGWKDRVPLSVYISTRLGVGLLDSDQHCCDPNTFKIVLSAECYEKYPYINHAKASVDVKDDVSIKIIIPGIGKEIVISDIRSKIEEQVRESLITLMTESKTVPTDDGDISIEAAISRIIALNLNYGPLVCPTLNGTVPIPIPMNPSSTRSNLNILSIMASPDGQKGDEKPLRIDEKPPRIDKKPPRIDEKPPRIDEKPPRIDEKPPRIDEEPQRNDEKPRRNDEKPPRNDEIPPRIDKKPRRIDEEPRRNDEGSPRIDEKNSNYRDE